MIQCTKCNLQYIGETKRRLKERFNEHRRPIINTSSYNPTAVSRHFITGNHTVNHMLLIPLEKLYTNRDSVRKAREAFLIRRGNTLEPPGLNRRDEMQSNQLFLFFYFILLIFIICFNKEYKQRITLTIISIFTALHKKKTKKITNTYNNMHIYSFT